MSAEIGPLSPENTFILRISAYANSNYKEEKKKKKEKNRRRMLIFINTKLPVAHFLKTMTCLCFL